MKKFRISALILAAAIAVAPLYGCKKDKSSKTTTNETSVSKYADIPNVGKNKYDVNINEDTNVNGTSYKLNRVIDSGKRKDGLKYIYLDVTIKNESQTDYQANGLNNFYLVLDDGTEILTDIRADLHAKQTMADYKQLETIPAGGEFTGYIGFCIEENINAFTVGFFPTADTEDKSNVIFCEVASEDIIVPPAGMFTETE